MKAEAIESVPDDVVRLYERMTENERRFLSDNWGVNTLDGMLEAERQSELCWTIFLDDEPVGIFGCARVLGEDGEDSNVGSAWLVTAPGIEKIKLRFVKHTKEFLLKLFERFDILICSASAENESLVDWIYWIGFEVFAEDRFVYGRLDKCACRWLSQ